jgi:hypothetical protein
MKFMLGAHIYIRISFACHAACTRISSPFPIHAARIIIYGLETAVISSSLGPSAPVVKLLAISLPHRSIHCVHLEFTFPGLGQCMRAKVPITYSDQRQPFPGLIHLQT